MGKSGAKKKKQAPAANGRGTAPTPATAAAVAAAQPPSPEAAAAVLSRANELKEEGNRLFQSRDFSAALRLYNHALYILPPTHPDRAIFHSNRAACLLQLRPVDHAAVVAECSLALRAQPGFPRALLRRARSLDALGRKTEALQDVLAFLSVNPSNPDALELASRLRPAVAAESTLKSRPSPAALGASALVAGLSRPLPKKQPVAQQPQPPPVKRVNSSPKAVLSNAEVVSPVTNGCSGLDATDDAVREELPLQKAGIAAEKPGGFDVRWRPLKLVYDHDIRLAQIPEKAGFRALREIVGTRFPSSRAVLIKYKDMDGDLVTITNSAELRLAKSVVDAGMVDDSEKPLPLLRLHVVEVSTEQEPPVPEEEDEKPAEFAAGEDGPLIKSDEDLSESSADIAVSNDNAAVDSLKEVTTLSALPQNNKIAKKACDHPECMEGVIDEWLLQFAELFRNQVGIDPEVHLDLHELGTELCAEALDETVTSEKAQILFEMAANKFQEVTALALFNWGNVLMSAARKKIPLDEAAPKDVMEAQLRNAFDWVSERYTLAGQKYEAALQFKPDFYEGLLALGQQQFETAKLHWSFALANKFDLSTWDHSETIRLFESAREKMMAATEMWEKAEEKRNSDLKDPQSSIEDEVLKKRKKQREGHEDLTPEELAEQAAVMRQQIHLFWGNMLFERSQVEFNLGMSDWKNNLDAAAERFKLAGASESDISVVLKNHSSNSAPENCEENKVIATAEDISKDMLKINMIDG